MTGTPPWITAVTVCKGRLHQLLQVLPERQVDGMRQIVVDSNCPDGTAQRLAEDFPWVEVVRHDDAGRFNLARARNAGAALATTDWLAFLDADGQVPSSEWSRWKGLVQPDHHFRMAIRRSSLFGSALVPKAFFVAIGGYDDVMEGWGAEDTDLYARLVMAGCAGAELGPHTARPVEHDDDMRTAHYTEPDHLRSQRQNTLYSQIKQDLLRHFGTHHLPRESRQRLYEQVQAALASSHDGSAWLDLKLPPPAMVLPGLSLRRTWHYELVRNDG